MANKFTRKSMNKMIALLLLLLPNILIGEEAKNVKPYQTTKTSMIT